MNLRLYFFCCLALLISCKAYSQTDLQYEISFQNRVHHEAEIELTINNTKDTLQLRMSRSSPGRYAIHEFAKNVYNVRAVDQNGSEIELHRPNPYQWDIIGHKGKLTISYTLFADRGDGTYSQIDDTHAHLNIPSTFMFARGYNNVPISLKINIPESSNWKVATQLKQDGEWFSAPDFQYFMDSPIEISNHIARQFDVKSKGETYSIEMALHHLGTEEEADEYFEKVKSVVLKEIEVFGELPRFENNRYTFLLCYMPNVSGDGMEHRNSTICTSTRSLKDGGMDRNISTISHEFFHAWNVERIRPASLEPFDFEKANMSGELWFAEGFTSYYTGLILVRAGLLSAEDYISRITGGFNYVVNSKGRNYFNPIEMSYQAPFVDAASSIDPVNRGNTFISYYSYGSVLGLALDLSLRNQFENLNLDGYMKMVWEMYGRSENPYTIQDLQDVLSTYANKDFASQFFSDYIYKSELPDFNALFNPMGYLWFQRIRRILEGT